MASIPTLTDETDWTDELLDQLRQAVATEQERRYTVRTAEQQAADLAEKFEKAVETKPATEWAAGTVVGPGEKITEGGVEYRNVSGAWLSVPPSQYPRGYRLTTEVPPSSVPKWAAGVAVKAGDMMSHEGTVYKVLQAHTTQIGWEPNKVPALWAKA